MFTFFSNRKEEKSKVPKELNFFNEKEYHLFINIIDSFFKENKIEYELFKDYIYTNSDIFGYDYLGLTNVSIECKKVKTKKYKKIIYHHFNNLISDNKDLKENIEEYDKINFFLEIKIQRKSFFRDFEIQNFVYKQITLDLLSFIVVNLKGSVHYITKKDLKNWNIEKIKLFDDIEKRTNFKYHIEKMALNNIEILKVTSDHFFNSNIIISKKKLLDLKGKYGIILSVPNIQEALLLPIENRQSLKGIDVISQKTIELYNKSSRYLSYKIYWLVDGNYCEFEYKTEKGKIYSRASNDILKLMNKIHE